MKPKLSIRIYQLYVIDVHVRFKKNKQQSWHLNNTVKYCEFIPWSTVEELDCFI